MLRRTATEGAQVLMTLDELIDQVVDDRVTLNSVLLKAKVLAYNLHADNLKVWLEGEINGYESETQLPAYRKNVTTESLGTFIHGYQVTPNHPIPSAFLSDPLKEFAQDGKRIDSVVAIQYLIDTDDCYNIGTPWPNEIVAFLNTELEHKKYSGGYRDAHNIIGRASLQTILNTTRNRLLTFLMELREQYPDLDISKSTSDSSTTQTA